MKPTDHPKPPMRLASPAPDEQDADCHAEDGSDTAAQAAELAAQPDLHALCEAWSAWCHSRRLYVKRSLPVSLLGRLTSKGTGRSVSGGPDAIASAELMAFHIAFLAQPEEALDRRVFELHYYRRVRNVKAAAAAVGVGRQHWYTLVRDCRQRIYIASRQILETNLNAGRTLWSKTGEGREGPAEQPLHHALNDFNDKDVAS